ncbi:MAG TPA: Ig-like domain-containing protein, partial [Aestuariivirgaceae bacterium]
MSDTPLASAQTVGVRRANDYRWNGENPNVDHIVNPNVHHGSGTQEQPELPLTQHGGSAQPHPDLPVSTSPSDAASGASPAPEDTNSPQLTPARPAEELHIASVDASADSVAVSAPAWAPASMSFPEEIATRAARAPTGVGPAAPSNESLSSNPNTAPVATADAASGDEDSSLSGNVLANDSDADASDVLTVAAVNGAAGNVGSAVAGAYGALTLNADGSWSFAPNAAANALASGETASDSFAYEVSDGHGGTSTATLAITLTGSNDGPIATADAASGDED